VSESCYFCREDGPAALETHHIVPRRHNGSDREKNLVTVCANCHRKLEALYDKRFYEVLGVEAAEDSGGSDELSEEERARRQAVKSLVRDVEQDFEEGAPVDVVVDRGAAELGADTVEVTLEKLKEVGELYQPNKEHLRSI